MFAQLFSVYLSGTAATPEIRVRILSQAIERNDINFTRPVLKALEGAISTHGGSRTIGAEYQGTKPPLQEWEPRIWKDVFDYWQTCFDFLVLLVQKNNELSDEAKNIIGHSIRGMINIGRVEMLDKAIKQVIAERGKYWPAAMESIKNSLQYDVKNMPQEGVDMLNEWLNLLSPDENSLEEKLKILVINPIWEHREDENGDYIDVAAEKAEILGKELSTEIESIFPYLHLLLSGEQRQAFVFGKSLALSGELNKIDDLINQAVNTASQIKNPNLSFIRGLLNGIHQKSISDWNSYLEIFSSRQKLIEFYPEMLCSGVK
jgi:hypothetical protein